MDIKKSILEKFKDGSFALLTDVQITRLLRLGKREGKLLREILDSLCREGELLCDSRFRYGTAEQFGARRGTFTGNERGFGFFTPDDGSGDLFIPHRAIGGALHKDGVLAISTGGRAGDEGEILAVLNRGMQELVGTYRREHKAGYVKADERKYTAEVFIPAGKNKNAKSGSKVVVRVNPLPGGTPFGEVTEVLGEEGDFFTEELSLLRAHSLREEFPAEVEHEAELRAQCPTAADYKGRTDFRQELIITVDGEDTRDIDDAISIRKRDGLYELGVHIADVTHYVARGSALDKEAFLRGTSVYFPDRVLPMLPKALSNNVCSLNEGEERLTLSCLMTVDDKGNVLKRRVVPSVICSRHRMTYTEVTAIANGEKDALARYPDLIAMIATAMELTRILKEARSRRGGIELDIKETKILYCDGKISIPDYERTLSHQMIEQFMVLANESVAALMTERGVPFLYRVHEPPAEEKAAEFILFLKEAGISPAFLAESVSPQDYQRLLNTLNGSPLYPLVNRIMLRSMSKAVYSEENLGHFGLASHCYCHFTSPIRRYPDLCIHRIIKESLRGEPVKERYQAFVKEAAARCSACERNAADAEREVDALYTVAYMKERIGEEFEGVISGVTAFGLFVELPNTVEGFIPIETLPDDYYEWIEERYLLKGTKHSFCLGERVKVSVSGVDWGARRTLFLLVR